MPSSAYLNAIRWNEHGLVPVVTQDYHSGKLLMVAWMNDEALRLTVQEGRAVYWSRSRREIWRKGEESGHIQSIREIRLDCDQDVVLLQVEQKDGIACHTGRESCFFQRLDQGAWVTVDPVLQAPGANRG